MLNKTKQSKVLRYVGIMRNIFLLIRKRYSKGKGKRINQGKKIRKKKKAFLSHQPS